MNHLVDKEAEQQFLNHLASVTFVPMVVMSSFLVAFEVVPKEVELNLLSSFQELMFNQSYLNINYKHYE